MKVIMAMMLEVIERGLSEQGGQVGWLAILVWLKPSRREWYERLVLLMFMVGFVSLHLAAEQIMQS